MTHSCRNCHSGIMQKPKDNHPSYLICGSCMAIELTYQPQKYQEEFHRTTTGSDIDILSVFGGFGSGKSRSTLQEVLVRALENPNGTGLLGAQTIGQLEKTTIKTFIEEICPPPLIESYNKSKGVIKLINGFTFFLIATDDEQKIRSLNAGIVHLEEVSNIKRSIYEQILSRMRDPFTKNRAVIVCSNPANTWIKDVFVDNDIRKNPDHPQHDKYNPYMRTFIWKTELNKYLPKNFIEMNTVGKPNWYVQKFFYGSFEYNSGAVYPTIGETFIEPFKVDPEKTDRFGIQKDWERIVGADWGLRNPTAVIFAAINPKTGEVIVYNEYYVREKTLPEHAKEIKKLVDEIPAGLVRFMVLDPATKARTNPMEGKSVQTHFQEYGLYFQMGNNALEYGILKVSSYIDLGKLKIYRNCYNLINELLMYAYPETDMDNVNENQDEKPIKANDHACFVAGTLIETSEGQKPISSVKIGDYVNTRLGFKKVRKSWMTGKNKPVFTVQFSNGTTITATGNHPIFVEGKGFIRLDTLRYGDIIKVSHNWEESEWKLKSLSGMEERGGSTVTKDTLNVIDGTYIKKNGSTIMEKFQKDIISIISTVIQKIMKLKIFSYLQQKNIFNYIQKIKRMTWLTLKESDHLQRNGIVQKKVENGIVNMVKELLRTWKKKNMFVNNVKQHSQRSHLEKTNSVQTIVNQHGEDQKDLMMKSENVNVVNQNSQSINTVKQNTVPVHVVQITAMGNADVYNLSVDGVHEYYANGVLVHNCDALRYLIARLPDDPTYLVNESYAPPKSYHAYNNYETLEYDDDEDYQVKDYLQYY